MTRFSYQAYLPNGTSQEGVIDAANSQQAALLLSQDGKRVSRLEPTGAGRKSVGLFSHGDIRRSELELFFSNLCVLVSAGLGVDQALAAVLENASSPAAARFGKDIADRIAAGSSFTAALEATGGVPTDAIAMLSAGERSGDLAGSLSMLVEYQAKASEQRRQLTNMLLYPAFLLILVIAALVLIATYLVPALMPIFETTNSSPPLLITILNGISEALQSMGVTGLVALVATVAVLLFGIIRIGNKAELLGATLTRIPIVGQTITDSELARYLQSLSIQLKGGVELPSALAGSAGGLRLGTMRNELSGVRDKVLSGEHLIEAIKSCRYVNRSGIVSVLSAGSDANKLPQAMSHAAGILSARAQTRTERALTFLTPAITIFMGAIIGGLALSVMSALLSINELALQ